MGPKATTATMISAMRYEDPTAAVDWLCRAFGFQPHAVYKDDAGNVVHAELSFGNGMIMLGPNIDSPFGRYMTMPKDAGGAVRRRSTSLSMTWTPITPRPMQLGQTSSCLEGRS